MIRTGRDFSEAIERAVREAERGTAAELIVVVARRSGSYLDIALATGAAVALFAPAVFPPVSVIVEIPFVFVVASWLVHRAPGLLRAIAPPSRMKAQVERAAASHFVTEAVHGTRARTGLLIYISRLEERVELVADFGLQGRVPPAAWAGIRWGADRDAARARSQDELLRGITSLGAMLKANVPAEASDVNEAPDAPRIVD
jgi:putative membrane protein